MTEDVIISLGFERVDVPKEESGDKNDYYYYTKDVGEMSFITNESDLLVNGQWVCRLFDYDVNISSEEDMKDLIRIFSKNK